VTLFVDTSVWSLALRRDAPPDEPPVQRLSAALTGGEAVYTTGIVLQEILQGYRGPRAREQIVNRFAALPIVVPTRSDHIEAAELRNECRRHGIQVGTIDALLAQLCIRHDLVMLTTDQDFARIADWAPFRLWRAP